MSTTGDILMILVILAGLSAFAMLAARLVRVDSTLLWPLGEVGHDAFWRRTLPWPRGVQEDTDIAWHVPRAEPLAEPPGAGERARQVSLGRPIPPTRPQRRIAGR